MNRKHGLRGMFSTVGIEYTMDRVNKQIFMLYNNIQLYSTHKTYSWKIDANNWDIKIIKDLVPGNIKHTPF